MVTTIARNYINDILAGRQQLQKKEPVKVEKENMANEAKKIKIY